ncbi:MAG: STAS domain-containing protein [Mariprofundaceae bacterium]
MSIKLDVAIDDVDDATVHVCVQGDVNIHTSPQLRKVLQPYFAADTKMIRVLLDDVPFMDSSGIATLVEGLQWSKSSEKRFVLSGLTDAVRDVFVLAKLDSIFEIVSEGDVT